MSLSAHWAFAGDATDSSGNGLDLTPHNSPTYTTGPNGEDNTAISLNGSNQYLDRVSSDAALNFGTGDFSMSVWAKSGSAANWDYICHKYDLGGSNTGYWIRFSSTGDQLELFFKNASNFDFFRPGVSLTDTWKLYTWTVDRSGNCLSYVDKTLEDTSSASAISATIDSTARFVVGTDQDGGNYWDGEISHLRVYKGDILSLSAIENLYDSDTSTGGSTASGLWFGADF